MTNEELNLKIEALRDEIRLRSEAHEKEEALYRVNIDKHLVNVNHANERIDNFQSKSVLNDVYTVQHKVVTDQIKDLQTFKDNQQGRQVIIPIAVSFIISGIFLLLNYFLSR